jgi:hypothetical protein
MDYSDSDVYFASRRLVAGLNWEHTGIFDSRNTLSLSGLCQFDVNDNESAFHSQYLAAKLAAPLSRAVNTEFGAVFELAERTGKDPAAAFAASVLIQWLLPTAPQDMLSLSGSVSSGSWNDGMDAFIPITSQAQGNVLRPALSGIAFIQAGYTVRLLPALSADVSGAYFFRTDTVTFYDVDMDSGSGSPLLGGEIYGGLTWSPFSDLALSLGGGLFLPRTGAAFADDAPVKYRVEAAASVSF